MESYDSFADQYDYLMKDISYEKWTDYLCSFFRDADIDVNRITDIGCGTGKITLILADRGYTVTGIDRSENMLRVASKAAREKGLHIQFSCQDLEDITVGKSDAICMNMDVLNYISQDKVENVLAKLFAGLRRGGILLFDISSGYKLREILGDNFYYEDHDDVTYFWKNSLDREAKKVDMELTFFVRKGELYERRDEYQSQYIHEENDIIDAALKAGFIVDSYEFGTRNGTGEKSERILFRCRKAK